MKSYQEELSEQITETINVFKSLEDADKYLDAVNVFLNLLREVEDNRFRTAKYKRSFQFDTLIVEVKHGHI